MMLTCFGKALTEGPPEKGICSNNLRSLAKRKRTEPDEEELESGENLPPTPL
jgi:hypothetical protein